MINYVESALCISAVSALAMPALLRKPKDIARLRGEVDEEMQYRINRLLRGPDSERITDYDLWSQMGGFRGVWKMVRQARIMVGIITEHRKAGTVPADDMRELAENMTRLWAGRRLTIGEMLTARRGDPRPHTRAAATAYAQIGDIFDRIVGQIDGQSVGLVS